MNCFNTTMLSISLLLPMSYMCQPKRVIFRHFCNGMFPSYVFVQEMTMAFYGVQVVWDEFLASATPSHICLPIILSFLFSPHCPAFSFLKI